MVKSPLAAAFKMTKPEFLLQFLVVAFDDPSLFGQRHQVAQRDILPQIGHPVLGRFGFPVRPFDQEPFLFARLVELVVPVCSPDAHTGKTRAQGMPCALPPGDRLPGFCRQLQRQLLSRDRSVLGIAAQPVRWSSTSAFLCRGRQWFDSRRPHRSRTLNAHHITQFHPGYSLTEAGVVAVSWIRQHRCRWDSVGLSLTHLSEGDFQLGLERYQRWDFGLFSESPVVSPPLGQIQAIGDGQTGRTRSGKAMVDGLGKAGQVTSSDWRCRQQG